MTVAGLHLNKPGHLLPALLALAVLSAALSISLGGVSVSLADGGALLARALGLTPTWSSDPGAEAVLSAIRGPRVLLGCIVGATLAVGGAVMQALFRNPLADPGLIGVSAGAALAASASIVLGDAIFGAAAGVIPRAYQLPLAAFAGGLAVTALVHALARTDGRTSVAGMLLAGIAINAIAGAVTGLFTYISDDQQLRQLTFWSMGNLGATAPGTLVPALALMLISTLGGLMLWRPLNLMLLGEAEAYHLGIPVDRMKAIAVVLVALGVGAAVAAAGPIAFVGLVAPHLVRLIGGSDHRLVLPGAALLGTVLVSVADLLARTIALPAELPVGLLIAAAGGPFFLGLLLMARKRGELP